MKIENSAPFKEPNEFPPLRKCFELEGKGKGKQIVRRANIRYLAEDLGMMSLENDKVATKVYEMFAELHNKYRLPVEVRLVRGGNNINDETLYLMTDKVEGSSLADGGKLRFEDNMAWALDLPDPERKRLIVELDKVFESLGKYVLDKVMNKDLFLWDLAPMRQYMWGKKLLDQEAHLYLVDIDLFINPEMKSTFLDYFVTGLGSYEQLLKTRFEKARVVLEQIRQSKIPDAFPRIDFNLP